MLTKKSFKDRVPFMRKIVTAPPTDLFRLFTRTRACISLRGRLPESDQDSPYLFFAKEWRKGKLSDVTTLHVTKNRGRFRAIGISLFEYVDIWRIPGRQYFAELFAAASTGSGTGNRGGKWAEKFGHEFIPQVADKIPRALEYCAYGRTIRCLWSARDKRLAPLLKDLDHASEERRVNAIAEIGLFDWDVDRIPQLVTQLKGKGTRAFVEAMSSREKYERFSRRSCVSDLLKRIGVACPELITEFRNYLNDENSAIRDGALRAINIVASQDAENMGFLFAQLDDPLRPSRAELQDGIRFVVKVAPNLWNPNVPMGIGAEQIQYAYDCGCRIINRIEDESEPEVMKATKLVLFYLSQLSAKLAKVVHKRFGKLREDPQVVG